VLPVALCVFIEVQERANAYFSRLILIPGRVLRGASELADRVDVRKRRNRCLAAVRLEIAARCPIMSREKA
jgi:hypothetical protein